MVCSLELVHAESDSNNFGSSFVISGNMPDNQQSESGYFDLLVSPNDKQVLEVVITNVTSEDIQVAISLADATTTNNGAVNYQLDEKKDRDSSLKNAFTDMASLEKDTYTIAANSSITVPVHLTVSDTEFSGVILGGITATEILPESEERSSDNEETSTGITNVYSYSIGVLLYETTDVYDPELVLNDVFAGQRNYRNYINANLQNIASRIIKDMSVEAKVYNSDGEIAYTSKSTGLKMAPNSNFDYGISLNETKFIAGDYSINLKVIADGVEFNFSKDFTITDSNAKQYNESAVLVESESSWIIILIIASSILLLALLFVIFKKKRNNKS